MSAPNRANVEKTSAAPHLFDPNASKEYLQRVIETVFRVDKIISTITDLPELLGLIMQESKLLVDAESSSLMLFDPGTQELYFEVALGPKGEEVKQIRLRLDQGIAGYAAREGISVNIPDVQQDKRFMFGVDQKTGYVTKSIVAVPMTRTGRLIGIIEVLNKTGGIPFTDDDVKILEVLAHIAAIAIENVRLYEENIRSERMAALGEAIAGMAHCVKNILTGMQGSSSLIEMALKEKKYEILQRAWEILKKSSTRVSTLVQNMLTYSKDRKPLRSAVALNDLVRDICDIQRENAKQEGVQIDMDLDPSVTLVLIDQTAIERAVQNLIVNAVDAISEAAYDREVQGCVLASTRVPSYGEYVQVRIADNGCGIADENLAKIWQAFFSTKGSGGTGLGLSVTAKIVQEHGGKIEVESKLGEGTTFIITLPVHAPAE